MVAAGKKAAITRATSTYTFEQHVKGKPQKSREIALAIQEFVMGLDPAIEEAPKKQYVAYRISQNIVCVEIQQKRVLLYLKLNPKQMKSLPSNARDVTTIGHYGTGDLELSIRNLEELESAKSIIVAAYQKVGG
jgi:predicted transport protein